MSHNLPSPVLNHTLPLVLDPKVDCQTSFLAVLPVNCLQNRHLLGWGRLYYFNWLSLTLKKRKVSIAFVTAVQYSLAGIY